MSASEEIKTKDVEREDEDVEKDEKINQATQLLALLKALSIDTALTPEGELWAKATNFPWMEVGGSSFENFCLAKWLEIRKTVIAGDAAKKAAASIKAMATFQEPDPISPGPPVYQKATRFAFTPGVIYLDKGEPGNCRALKISAGKIEIDPDPPIIFVRSDGALPLPDLPPEKQRHAVHRKSLVSFKSILRLADEDLVLVMVFLFSCLAPSNNRFMLALEGHAGSGKTTFARLLRMAIDPDIHSELTKPSTQQDFYAACNHCYVYAIDNLSSMPVWLVDSLCTLLTGGTGTFRKLYTNGEVARFRHLRPVIITSIGNMTWREDLGSRSLVINVPEITDADRASDAQLFRDVEAIMPGLLSLLCTAAAEALRNPRPNLVKHRQQALVDWCVACCGAIGISSQAVASALETVANNNRDSQLEASPITGAMMSLASFMVETDKDSEYYTTAQLLKRFETEARRNPEWARHEHYPRNPRALGHKLADAQLSLSKIGIKISKRRDNASKGWLIDVTGYTPAKERSDGFSREFDDEFADDLDDSHVIAAEELEERREKKLRALGLPKPVFDRGGA